MIHRSVTVHIFGIERTFDNQRVQTFRFNSKGNVYSSVEIQSPDDIELVSNRVVVYDEEKIYVAQIVERSDKSVRLVNIDRVR